jgi:hypothetical protein
MRPCLTVIVLPSADVNDPVTPGEPSFDVKPAARKLPSVIHVEVAGLNHKLLVEIPLGQTEAQNAQRFNRTLLGTEPGWELKWTGKGFYES